MATMEHRCGERFSLNLPAIVHKPGGERVPVTLRNVSAGGAFVAVSADCVVLSGVVQLEIRVAGNDPDCFVWRAWIIRQQPDGAALMFDDRQRTAPWALLAARRDLPGTPAG